MVSLRNPRTGDVRILPEGWSWGCFLGSGLLGLPLFRRGLLIWGAVMVVFNAVALIVEFVPTHRAATLYDWLWLIGIGACAFFGANANRMAIDRHLANGWEYGDNRRRGF